MNTETDLVDSVWLISGNAEVDNYLYVGRYESQPIFVGIQEEMAQLNDFCLLCIQSTSKRLRELRQTAKHLRDGKEHMEDPDIGDVSYEAASGLEEFEIPLWEDTERFIVRAMCLVLLSAFLEKSLKDLASYLYPPEAPKLRRKGGDGEVASLLIYLQETCKLDFEEPESTKITREKCRKIRNEFAHGRWDNVKDSVTNYSLSTAFGAVTALFEAIDEASEIKS